MKTDSRRTEQKDGSRFTLIYRRTASLWGPLGGPTGGAHWGSREDRSDWSASRRRPSENGSALITLLPPTPPHQEGSRRAGQLTTSCLSAGVADELPQLDLDVL